MEFEDTRDADDAVYELNGKDLCGERVIVEHARGPRRDRDGYGGVSLAFGCSKCSQSSRLAQRQLSFVHDGKYAVVLFCKLPKPILSRLWNILVHSILVSVVYILHY